VGTQHVGKYLLTETDVVGILAAERLQEPAAHLLTRRVMVHAQGDLRHLRHERLGITQQRPLERAR
jgi:hypothetical protein